MSRTYTRRSAPQPDILLAAREGLCAGVSARGDPEGWLLPCLSLCTGATRLERSEAELAKVETAERTILPLRIFNCLHRRVFRLPTSSNLVAPVHRLRRQL